MVAEIVLVVAVGDGRDSGYLPCDGVVVWCWRWRCW